MKKIALVILIIALILTCGIVLSACNNATTQGQLANLLTDHNQETFVYDVLNKFDNTQGTYTVRLQAYDKGESISDFGNATLENVDDGVLVSGLLTIGDITYRTGCYFNLISGSSFMVPAYTFRVEKKGNVETFRLQGSYDGATLNYERYINGKKSTGSVKASGTYYDNNEFQQSLRTVTTFSTSFNFGFTMPLVSAKESTKINLTASCSATQDVTVPYRTEAINCYRVNLSRSTDVNGVSQQLYYATDNLTYNGWNMKNVLVKFIEHYKDDASGNIYDIEYSLKEASLA